MNEESRDALLGLGLPREEREKFCQEAKKSKSSREKDVQESDARSEDPRAARRGPVRRRVPESIKHARESWIHKDSSDVPELLEEVSEHKETMLNSWEQEFVESIEHQVEMNGGLTRKQYDALVDVVDRCRNRFKRV